MNINEQIRIYTDALLYWMSSVVTIYIRAPIRTIQFSFILKTFCLTILTYLIKCCKNDVKINIMSKSMFLFDLADISENGTMVCEQKL